MQPRAADCSGSSRLRGSIGRVGGGEVQESETPGVPGSTSYGNQLPRIATWARFVQLESGASLQVLTTHYDHRSQASREQASQQLLALSDLRSVPRTSEP